MTERDSKLAPYAVAHNASRGRAHAEPASAESPFEIDRRRILQSAAFRRLVGKTQVFIARDGDHFRTRMTHTLEVVGHAQRLARRLQLNATLAGAVAMAHDLGHPPFGHAGEVELSERMKPYGEFEHNVQSLRVVDYLEHPYPGFRGLNLSFELRESLVKHNTPYDRPRASDDLKTLMAAGPLPVAEGQVVGLADQIAYMLHDIEDALMQGLLDEKTLRESALWRTAAEPVRTEYPDSELAAIRRPILDRLDEYLHDDVVAESTQRLQRAEVRSPDDVRTARSAVIGFSTDTKSALAELLAVLSRHVYKHYHVARMDSKARRLIGQLFAAYEAEPALMPPRFVRRIDDLGVARVICDYIAGMTDGYCRRECARLFEPGALDE